MALALNIEIVIWNGCWMCRCERKYIDGKRFNGDSTTRAVHCGYTTSGHGRRAGSGVVSAAGGFAQGSEHATTYQQTSRPSDFLLATHRAKETGR